MGSPCGRLTRHSLELNGVATFGAHELRPGRVLPLPRDGGVLPTGQNPPVGACRFPAASPAPRYSIPSVGPYVTRRPAVHWCSPYRSSPCLWPRTGGGSWAYPRASHLAVTHDARRGGDVRALDRLDDVGARALGHGPHHVAAGGPIGGADHRPSGQACFQAGGPDGSANAAAANGRCEAPITAACAAGRSPAKTSRKDAGSMLSSTAVSAPCPIG